MEIKVSAGAPEQQAADLLAVLVTAVRGGGERGAKKSARVPTARAMMKRAAALAASAVAEDKPAPLPASLRALDGVTGGALARVFARGDFHGRKGERVLVHSDGAAQRVLLIGVGPERALDTNALRLAAGVAMQSAQRHRARVVALLPPPSKLDATATAQALAEGALLGAYRFDRHQHAQEPRVEIRETTLLLAGSAGAGARSAARATKRTLTAAQAGARVGVALASSQNLARDLSNEAPNLLPPVALAEAARRVARETGLKLRILLPAELKRRSMGALLAVAQGSANPPRVIVLEHNAPARGKTRTRKPVCLIGKGVCFDSGGLSLKPPGSMVKMKHDMSGGAAVLGAMRAAALLKLPEYVVGIIGAVENMPDGGAYRVDDVLVSASGKSIEVTNTDAEGRLVLADCMHFAQTEYAPRAMLDFATLTGACVVALGHWAAGALGNHAALRERMVAAGEATGERYWPLPLWDVHREHMKSRIADVRQTGGREAGTVTAAAFLSHFVGDVPWLHLDIAGTANTEKPTPLQAHGATGFGVRSTIALLQTGLKKL